MFPHSKISEAEIESAQAKEKPYKLTVGAGLYVLIYPNGSKYWRLKYYFHGKQSTYSIGVFPQVSLEEAIQSRDEAKRLIKNDCNPNEVKRLEKKSRQKPASLTSQFRMDISDDGLLTIETAKNIIKLTPAQVKALQAFLAISITEGAA